MRSKRVPCTEVTASTRPDLPRVLSFYMHPLISVALRQNIVQRHHRLRPDVMRKCAQALLTLMCACLLVCMCVCVSQFIGLIWIDAVSESMLFEVPVEYTARPYFLILRRRTKAGSPEGRLWADLCLSSIDEWRHNRWCHALGTAKKARFFQQRDRACSHKLET